MSLKTNRRRILEAVLVASAALGAITLIVLMVSVNARAALNLELGRRDVQRRPFDVPRLFSPASSPGEESVWGRPVTFEELQTRIRHQDAMRWSRPEDFTDLIALDPQRGLRFVRETFESRLPPIGETGDSFRSWDSIVAGLDDAWALDYRKVVLDRYLSGNWDAITRQRILERERVDDLTSVPGEGGFNDGRVDEAAKIWHAHLDGAQAPRILFGRGVGDSIPAPILSTNAVIVRGWRGSSDVAHTFRSAPQSKLEDFAGRASLYYPDAPEDVRKGILVAQRQFPDCFRGTTLSTILAPDFILRFSDLQGAQLDQTGSLTSKEVSSYSAIQYWALLSPARRKEIRVHALSELQKGQAQDAIMLHEVTPDDRELAANVRNFRWKQLDIVSLVRDEDPEALDFARRWVADGNPLHQVDGALLASLPQADAITAPILHSSSSGARAALLLGLLRRKDPEARRRVTILSRDPAARIRYLAKLGLAGSTNESRTQMPPIP